MAAVRDPKIAYRTERATALLADPACRALLEAHYREIGQYPDIALDVDEAAYAELEARGAFRVYTARAGHELVGYAAFLVGRNPHYRQSLQARCDVFYVAPDWRGGRIGLGLVRHSERALAAEGVQVVYHHTKVAHPALARLLAHLGYEAIEVNYAKRLDAAGRD